METGLVKELIETSMKILNENEKIREISDTLSWEQMISKCLNTEQHFCLRSEWVSKCIDRLKYEHTGLLSDAVYDELGFSVVHTSYYPLQSELLHLLILLIGQQNETRQKHIMRGFPPVLRDLLQSKTYAAHLTRSQLRKAVLSLNRYDPEASSFHIDQCAIQTSSNIGYELMPVDNWLDVSRGIVSFYHIKEPGNYVVINLPFPAIYAIQLSTTENVIIFVLRDTNHSIAFRVSLECAQHIQRILKEPSRSHQIELEAIGPSDIFNRLRKRRHSDRVLSSSGLLFERSQKRPKRVRDEIQSNITHSIQEELNYITETCAKRSEHFQEMYHTSVHEIHDRMRQITATQIARGHGLQQAEFTIRMALEDTEVLVKTKETERILTEAMRELEIVQDEYIELISEDIELCSTNYRFGFILLTLVITALAIWSRCLS